MNETTLMPISLLAFAGIVFLSIYLERIIEKKRKELARKRKLNVQLADSAMQHIDNNLITGYYDDVLNASKKSTKKLKALEQVNI